jgi:hypothetical protein
MTTNLARTASHDLQNLAHDEMSDEAFAAHWDGLIEAAALAGDEAEVERLMLAYGEAFTARYPD